MFHAAGENAALAVHAERGCLKSFGLHRRGGAEYGMVLHRRNNDMLFSAAGRRGTDCPIVRFGSAGSKINLVRVRAERGGHRFSGGVQGPARPAARRVDGRRVAELRRQVRRHRFQCVSGERRRCRVVQVNHAAQTRPFIRFLRRKESSRRQAHCPQGKTRRLARVLPRAAVRESEPPHVRAEAGKEAPPLPFGCNAP